MHKASDFCPTDLVFGISLAAATAQGKKKKFVFSHLVRLLRPSKIWIRLQLKFSSDLGLRTMSNSPHLFSHKRKYDYLYITFFHNSKAGINNMNWFSGGFVVGHLYQQYITVF